MCNAAGSVSLEEAHSLDKASDEDDLVQVWKGGRGGDHSEIIIEASTYLF